jgi:hypothetical protein
MPHDAHHKIQSLTTICAMMTHWATMYDNTVLFHKQKFAQLPIPFYTQEYDYFPLHMF